MKITVVGGGRMGLPLACVMAKNGASVTVADVNLSLVQTINEGHCTYEEPGLKELLSEVHSAGRLDATQSTREAVSASDAVIVIVPAHLTDDRDIDFSVLQQASCEVGKGLREGALVVYETTIAVGGTRRVLVPLLEEFSGLVAGRDFSVAYSPERVKANKVLSRLEETHKVIGGLDDDSRKKAIHLYSTFLGAPVDDVGTTEAAEMTKLLGMLYRDVNIALANELAAFCEVADVDFERIRAAANTDGEANLLSPGIGVGGHCTPVYPYFLTRESRRLGVTQRISEAAREINDHQPGRQIDRISSLWGSLKAQKIHLMGLGFRPGVKVDTFSPTYTLKDELEERGAIVTLEDPHYTDDELRASGFSPGTAEGARAVILSTAHEEFTSVDFASWLQAGVEVVLDGRDLWCQRDVEDAGLTYLGVGHPTQAAD